MNNGLLLLKLLISYAEIQFNIFKNDSRKYIKSNVNNGLDLKTKKL